MINERNFARIHFDCLVEFSVGDAKHLCELLDISLRGALIANCSGASPGAGTACKLILSLSGSSDAQIIMEGNIAHKKENRIGINCKMIDLDSMTHLRKLVKMNLSDPALLKRDMNSLWFDSL